MTSDEQKAVSDAQAAVKDGNVKAMLVLILIVMKRKDVKQE
ncbi:MAG: hypothetical protein WAO35_07165 [Terriglobia bacterium]